MIKVRSLVIRMYQCQHADFDIVLYYIRSHFGGSWVKGAWSLCISAMPTLEYNHFKIKKTLKKKRYKLTAAKNMGE